MPDQPAAGFGKKGLSSGRQAAEGGRVLVVDDDRTNRLKLSASLTQQGYQVSLAESGLQALQVLASEPFDVVLLDILTPDVGGCQVLERMKGDQKLRDIPVIVIYDVDEMDRVVGCIEMGAEDYLSKTFDPVLLQIRISASLQLKKLRDLEKFSQQSEKLATLGKLSAGLAHELNNPAAAAQRGSKQLQTVLSRLQQVNLNLSSLNLNQTQRDQLVAFDSLTRERSQSTAYMDSLTRSDREAELEAWLQANLVENAWEVAPNLVGLGYESDELSGLLENFPGPQFLAAIEWLECTSMIYSLLEEINQGTGRIAEIVKALKAYSYMDQTPVQNVNVHEGLDNTLVILRSKLREGVTVHREYSPNLPLIEAYTGELNQVWTNLIDNAIDAMDGKGEITLRTRQEGQWVVVEIEDTGPGIPEDIQSSIFEPFFTTKGPGKGTGMGLNITHSIITQRHQGKINLYSQPGRTRFEVWLPLHLAKNG